MEQKKFEIKSFVVLVIIVSSVIIASYSLSLVTKGEYTYALKSFSSYDELESFLEELQNSDIGQGYGMMEDSQRVSTPDISVSWEKSTNGAEADGDSVDYSETNVQVEGVDEPDIVKTDGTYLYILSGNSVFIVLGYPAEDAQILSEILFDSDITISGLFVNDDRLVVFGTTYNYYTDVEYTDYWYGGESKALVKVYDISDHSNPDLVRDVEVDGYFFDSRMIGDYVYMISSEYSYMVLGGYYGVDETDNPDRKIDIPEITVNDVTTELPPSDIFYVDIPEPPDTITYVVSFDVHDDSKDIVEKGFIMGNAQTMYVSEENIYIIYTHYNYATRLDSSSSSEATTLIHRIAVHNGAIEYTAQGEVPGTTLNQFSMDEHNGYFRIATTSGSLWGGEAENNLYILDMDLERISEIENIAPGESIYSARFIGDRAYLVTFKKIDPFFTIDLSDPYNPEILGELKIPGYSDYLHPFDDDHIIGIGKDTVEATEEEGWWRSFDFTWHQGVKIALFDVSDFTNPSVLDQVIIGDRGTNSPALHDHKAFLFDRNRELLVIPVSLYEISDEQKEQYEELPANTYGEYVFQGAYVYQLNLNGFDYKGRITHMEDDDLQDEYWYYWSSPLAITRTLYIGDILYTISGNMVKMNDLDTLDELNSIKLD